MSGGHFNYSQEGIRYIEDRIEDLIFSNDIEDKDDWGDPIGRGYSDEIIEKFEMARIVIKLAYIYAQRVDWLVSCDDGPDSFLKRLEFDINKAGDDVVQLNNTLKEMFGH